MRTRHEVEAGEKPTSEFERLDKEVLGLREHLNRAAETLVSKDPQLIKLDNNYPALRRSERCVGQELAPEQRAPEERKAHRVGLKLLMRELGGQLWRKGC